MLNRLSVALKEAELINNALRYENIASALILPADGFYGIIMFRDFISRINKIKQAIVERWLFFALLTLFLFLSFCLTKEIINRRQIDRKISEYKERITELQADNSALNDKVMNFSQSAELEGSVRSKLGMQKPGEHTIIIVRSAATSQTVKTNQEVVAFNPEMLDGAYATNPQKWWNYFFGQ